MKQNIQNWFDTLRQALESEGLEDSFPLGSNISYGENFKYTYDDGTKHGHFVSIYRDSTGRYERPIHYGRG